MKKFETEKLEPMMYCVCTYTQHAYRMHTVCDGRAELQRLPGNGGVLNSGIICYRHSIPLPWEFCQSQLLRSGPPNPTYTYIATLHSNVTACQDILTIYGICGNDIIMTPFSWGILIWFAVYQCLVRGSGGWSSGVLRVGSVGILPFSPIATYCSQ